MKRNKCGHKAGPNCIICNDTGQLADMELSQHLAAVYKLMDVTPTILAAQMADPDGPAAGRIFMEALDIPKQAPPDPAVINRLCKLTICATNTAAQMVALADGRTEWTLEHPPTHWTPQHLLAARMLVAAGNNDPSMLADLLVAALAGLDPTEQLDLLCGVFYLQIIAAWKSREVAHVRGAAT